MTYSVTTFDGSTKTYTVTDQSVDTAQAPIAFFGRGAVNYGQNFAQNLVYLLENFASNSPTALNALHPLRGQTWFDYSINRLKVNIGAVTPNWVQVGGSTVSSTTPLSPLAGDMWYDTVNVQFRVYNGASFAVIGPPARAASAPSSPSQGDTWYDTTNNQLKAWNGSAWLIIGPSSNYAGNIATGGLIGSANCFFIILNANIVGIWSDSTVVAGSMPTNVTINGVTYTVAARFTGGLIPGLNVTTTGGLKVNATAVTAQYADVGERYTVDEPMMAGDVVELGGIAEITKTRSYESLNVFGVVSANPAIEMNSRLTTAHACVALAGRVPVKVTGSVSKGQRLVSSAIPGIAVGCDLDHLPSAFAIIGRAIADKSDTDIGVIEAVVGAK